MASLYKKPITRTDPKSGQRVKAKSKKWWGRYRDASGVERRVPLASDKTAAQSMLNELVIREERKRDALLPISPDFAELLLATPPADREGLVFGIEGLVRGKPIDTQRASRIVSDMGEAAKIVVDVNDTRPRLDKKTGATAMVPRYATAHDLRRAFGTRWSKRVMPATLQKLMRHASIETTMRYYVEHHSDDISADLWRWQSNELGSVVPETKTAAPSAAEIESRKSLAGSNS